MPFSAPSPKSRSAPAPSFQFCGRQLVSNRIDRNLLLILANTLKTYYTVLSGEQGIVRTLTYALTGIDMSASLTNQDVAGQYELTIGTLHTQPLGFGITAVLGGTNTSFNRAKQGKPLQRVWKNCIISSMRCGLGPLCRWELHLRRISGGRSPEICRIFCFSPIL